MHRIFRNRLRILAVAVCLLLALSSCGTNTKDLLQPKTPALKTQAAVLSGNLSEKVAENHTYELLVNADAATFTLRNRETGYCWHSYVPESYYDTKELTPTQVAGLSSMFTLYYSDLNASSSQVTTVNSIKTVSKISNGVAFGFQFASLGISLSVEVTLDDDGLHVLIPFCSIKETQKYAVTSIELLPYFGATNMDDGGYMVYPDGCGAITYFHTDKILQDLRTKLNVYSEEEINIEKINQNKEDGIQSLMLPVFGISRADGHGFAGIVTDGIEESTVNLSFPGLMYNLYRVGPEFKYRKRYTYKNSDDVELISIDKKILEQDCGITYIPLEDDQANYSGIANASRKWLLKSGRMVPAKNDRNMPLLLDFFMGTTEKQMMFERYISMTTFSQVTDILQELKKNQVDSMVVSLIGSNKKGYGYYTDHSISSKLGGQKELKQLAQYASSNNISLLLEQNYLQALNGQSGFSKGSDAIYKANGIIVTDEKKEEYYLTPQKSAEQMVSNVSMWKELGITGIRFSELGSRVYSNNYRSKALNNSQTVAYWKEMLNYTQQELGCSAVQGGNQYVLTNSNYLYDIPLTGSGYAFTDAYIPLYQMIVHGSIPYTSETFNSFYDKSYQLLKAMEYGVLPYYELTYEETSLLRNTEYNQLFTSAYADWKDEVVHVYKDFREALNNIWNVAMVRHEILSDTLVRVTYENGAILLLNYDETKNAEINGVTVPAMSYRVLQS